MSKNTNIRGIELFAGAGGLALGLEEAGIEGLAFVEYNNLACETLRYNRPKRNIIEGDIHNVDFTMYNGDVDLISGGPPCQAFSYAGKRLGFGDIRGTLFEEFRRAVKEVQPKMFLFENVKGMVTHDQGRTFKTIKYEFESLGYVLQYEILNAAFHGVAQKRQRLFMVGIREDLVSAIKFNFPEPEKKMTVLKEVLKDVPKSPYLAYSENKKRVMELIPQGGCRVDLPEKIAKEYMGKSYYSGGGRRGMARRISRDEPSLTLTTSPSQKQTERCHPDETRPFTIREYARIQSFPDDWEFIGSISEQYKQIGNAVPVELAKRIGNEIIKAFKKQEEF